MNLQESIEHLFGLPAGKADRDAVSRSVGELKDLLNRGEIRAAGFRDGSWHVNEWVKKGILLAFRFGTLAGFPSGDGTPFFDKDTMSLRKFTLADSVRVVPGGSAVRDGAYVAPGVVMMPPSYINIGAYVDEHTLVDSHALIGSCAQIGKRVHVSAAAQIGGVLEPVGSMPVIVEDDVFIGGNSGIYEGTIVKSRAVVGAGVILTGSTPVYDLVHQTIYRKSGDQPLVIPESAVIISGNRHIHQPFAKEHHLSVYAPIIVKYRDDRTDVATALEESLR